MLTLTEVTRQTTQGGLGVTAVIDSKLVFRVTLDIAWAHGVQFGSSLPQSASAITGARADQP